MGIFDENWSKAWSFVFYPENPISCNAATHKWLVPIDAMLVYCISQKLEWCSGSAYAVVGDDPEYKHIVNTHLLFYF